MKTKSGPKITSCSVRILRSFDYCHFEITLGGTGDAIHSEDTDALRKRAMRLADKAVEQYKIAKTVSEARINASGKLNYLRNEAHEIEEINEGERTPDQKAKLKHYNDVLFLSRRQYDYEDDWRDEKEDES